MARRLTLGLLVVAVLSGCALPTERPGLHGMSWSRYDHDGPVLTLGLPNSDHLAVMLSCEPGSGRVEVTAAGRTGEGAVIELQSGKVWNRYPGVGVASELTLGEVDIEVTLAAADPVLQAFADSGDLTIVYTGRRVVAPNGFAPAHDFLVACRLP